MKRSVKRERIAHLIHAAVSLYPDDAGELIEVRWEDYPIYGFDGLSGVKMTLSGWATNSTATVGDWDRGLIDTNSGFADGSVTMYDKVDDRDEIYDRNRMARVPEYQKLANDVHHGGWWNHLPRGR